MVTRTPTRINPYQDNTDPTRSLGEVSVTGSKTIDLGIKHNNYKVVLSPAIAAGECLEVYLSKNTTTPNKGSFVINVKESAGRLIQGGRVIDPTTASTQATGASGTTAWRVDRRELFGAFGGVADEVALAADVLLANGDVGLTDGKSLVAAVIVTISAGAFVMDKVLGTAATTGTQVAPTDAAIQTALGAGVKWLRLCDATINRTGDTTVTQSQNNKVRYTGKASQTAYTVAFEAVVDSSVAVL